MVDVADGLHVSNEPDCATACIRKIAARFFIPTFSIRSGWNESKDMHFWFCSFTCASLSHESTSYFGTFSFHMVLTELGSRLSSALGKLIDRPVVDTAALEELLREIQRALLEAGTCHTIFATAYHICVEGVACWKDRLKTAFRDDSATHFLCPVC